MLVYSIWIEILEYSVKVQFDFKTLYKQNIVTINRLKERNALCVI
jgi:hypothetical protein